ncbi:DUF2845 domain-containing protein [Dyella sedimenti]|jgi:hypothetical protein|uniref:DUF2845 domain-containing protein n=1 Tax=Dyella sedimenti TaxID=2919947 RepID=UPI001FAB12A6|nr:DUF2845 domain-containing protein [Dyella sedimenti]
MRGCGWVVVLMLWALAAQAGSGTLRVGSQVLVVGDSAARVMELLGKPAYRSRAATVDSSRQARGRGVRRTRSRTQAGEQWQYRDGRRLITVVVVDGKVSAIRDDGR